MGSSDPFLAKFEIQFGSLKFWATWNDYLMRLTIRDELHPWRTTGPGSMPTTPATDAPTPAQAAAASTPTSRCHRRSGQRSSQACVERRWATCAAARGAPPPTITAASPAGEHVTVMSQFPPRDALCRHDVQLVRQH
jgi:hypothetical protein